MKILPPMKSPPISLIDIEGRNVQPGQGRKLLLSLFREATCPFCNFRVFELTHNYPGLSSLGVDIVAVFYSTPDDVRKFIARQPRPFRMVADPEGTAHELFGVDSSWLGKVKAMMLRLPALMRGMKITGMRGMSTGNLMPADFLIDEQGNVVETYYGKDAGDHIPMERIELFAVRGLASKQSHAA
jgi:thioredoxin-dependent peroxiredoxin